MTTNNNVCSVADSIARLALALKEPELRNRVWIHKMDDNWTIAVNGKKEPVKIEPAKCMAAELQPFDFAVWWHGWLAGTFNPFGGIFAAGSEANEDSFLKDVDKAIEKAHP